MSNATVSNIEKAAVLLSRLDPKATDKVLEILGPDFAGKLRPMLATIAKRKDLKGLTEQVLQEYRDLQRDVYAAIQGAPTLQSLLGPQESLFRPMEPASPYSTQSPLRASVSPQESASPPQSSTLPETPTAEQSAIEADSLSKVPHTVLAAALKGESPRMISIVLKQLPSDISGKGLESLPLELRQDVFLLMADSASVHPMVVSRIMQKLLEVTRTIDPGTIEQADRRVKTLIGVLQSVKREERVRLMESLAERDPELAKQVDNLMYDYTDLLRIEDRSVQKLLGQLEQKIVATALKTASEELRQKVLKNLSERVRLALNEEMDLLSGVSAGKADNARREIANVIRSQDKEGSLVWIE